MDRVNYLFYQLFLKIKYEKRRYFIGEIWYESGPCGGWSNH